MKRFWNKIKKTKNGCWLWTGDKFSNKHEYTYGRIKVKKKVWKAHRFAWELINGPIPKNLFVLHKCDKPACVNPRHLFLGTQKDNMQDCAIKGRHGRRKLTKRQIKQIRIDPRVQIKIAADYGISQFVVSKIKRRIIWTHVI